MKKILLSTLLLSLVFGVTSLSADSNSIKKGQKVYLKKLKSKCQMSGARMAVKHTQSEWKEIYDGKNLNIEMKKECPKIKKDLKPKHESQLFDFLYEYGSDSGNVPSC